MKTIQEVLNEYSIELKSEKRHATVYTCKKVLQENKSTTSPKRKVFSNATQQNDLCITD